MKIGIINYGRSNIGSVRSALKFYAFNACDVTDPDDLNSVDIIILAGVGNFSAAHSQLKSRGFWDVLDRMVMDKATPILGICLGMQLFADRSFENGEHEGFGWIPGEVIKINDKNLKIPHIGWDLVSPTEHDGLFRNIKYGHFYFMHSYHFRPERKDTILATTDYSGFPFVSAVKRDHIVGVQFHPEKSQIDGLRFIKNFVEMIS